MLSASGIRHACPKCQSSLGLLKQLPRPVQRLNGHYTPNATRRLAQRSLRLPARAFSSTSSWRTVQQPGEEPDSSRPDIEQFVRDTKQRFRDTLPQGYLNDEEYALYLRLYGPPLRETEPDDVGIPTHADMGAEAPESSSKEGTILRELEGGEFEEINYELAPNEVMEAEEEIVEEDVVLEQDDEAETIEGLEEMSPEQIEEILALRASERAEALAQKDPDYIDTVARNQREFDAMKKLQRDFEIAQEKERIESEMTKAESTNADEATAVETFWPPEREFSRPDPSEEDVGEFKRFHPLSLEGRFHDSPVEIPLPKDELITPVREMLVRTHIRHVKTAAEAAFGGPGLPLSPVTLVGQKNGNQKPVGLPPGQRHMTEIEGDAFLAGYLPPAYASSMAVLREVRKRLGGQWLQSMLKRPDGSGPRILDAGAGGGGLLAWDRIVDAEWEILKEKGEARGEAPGKKTVLAASDRLRDRLKSLLHNTTFLPRLPDYQHSGHLDGEHLDAGSKPLPRKSYDVVIASHLLLAEKYDHHRQAVLNNLWNLTDKDGGVLIFVEKAHPRGFEAVAHARDTVLRRFLVPEPGQPTEAVDEFNPAFHRVLEDGHIIAPCTTHATCPMYKHQGKSEGRRDFCHFSQRFVAPTFYSRMTAGNSQGEVEFSYVAFQRGVPRQPSMLPREATEQAALGYEDSSSKPDMRQLPRMIMPPLKRTGHVTLDVCTPEGKTERWTVPKSFSKLAYHDARKARWGDLWALGAKTRVERKVRIGRGEDDGGIRAGREGGKGPRKVSITVDGDRVSAAETNVGRSRRDKKRDRKARSDDLLREIEDAEAEAEVEFDAEAEAVWAAQEEEERAMRLGQDEAELDESAVRRRRRRGSRARRGASNA